MRSPPHCVLLLAYNRAGHGSPPSGRGQFDAGNGLCTPRQLIGKLKDHGGPKLPGQSGRLTSRSALTAATLPLPAHKMPVDALTVLTIQCFGHIHTQHLALRCASSR